MQPVCTAVSTPCHADRGLAGHPRCVNVHNDYGKMRLYTPIHSKTTALLHLMSLDLKDAYFHIQVAPHHRWFLRYAFEGVHQYKVLLFGLSLAPRTFTRCMDVALSHMRQMRIRVLNYLDGWLILAQSQTVLTSHKTLLLSHLDCLGLRVYFAKSLMSPSQRVLFLGTVTVSAGWAMTIPRHAASFKKGPAHPLKAFQRMLGLMAVLAESEGSIRGLVSRTPPRNGDSGLCISPGPLEGPLLAKARRDHRHSASTLWNGPFSRLGVKTAT